MIRNIGLLALFLLLLYWLGKPIRKPALVAGSIHTISQRPVKELDALQTSAGTLITAAMERQDSAGLDHVISLYRSENGGAVWLNTFILNDTSFNTRQYADPRLVYDPLNHRIYLVAMRVRFQAQPKRLYKIPKRPYQSDLVLYRSEDDGESWTFLGTPHTDTGDVYADLPYLALDDRQCLLLIASHINLKYLLGPSQIVLARSCDGGKSWPLVCTVTDSLIKTNRKNLGNIQMIDRQTAAAVFTDESLLYFATFNSTDSLQVLSVKATAHPFPMKGLSITFLNYNRASKSLGLLCYLPHRHDSPIWYAESRDDGDSWQWQKITDQGAYPSIFSDAAGILHLTFSQIRQKEFQLWHTSSENNFADRTMLHHGRYRNFEAGEYQSLFQGKDGQIHLLFCDASDESKAKHLSFSTSSVQ